ncbi:mitochondrial assembly of ribosomal large subunit protein 1 [Camponotus floridanus]|uniref:mitochondrial assembly of ribosomal large subunit protein 1 n=1 Tax=Camponotus floridanus TaxID=104421 RepID=UPI000DC6AB04|nr:mitochondrial assembly of ribosomal large subunit protein 1 [Camponotus floridanus]
MRILRNLLRAQRISRKSFSSNRTQLLTYSQLKLTRQFASKPDRKPGNCDTSKENDDNLPTAINMKYKAFHDEDADVILDVSEEMQKISLEEISKQEIHDPYADINLSHGTTGVYDIEDLVALLEGDKANNIFVAKVPKEYAYVDYIVVVTGKSQKHMNALATFVRKVYKQKRYQTDLIPKIEGQNSKDWIALDLGNIALHIFSLSAREHYDLETLWTVGSQYDDKSNKPEELNIMDKYNAFLADLHPADIA